VWRTDRWYWVGFNVCRIYLFAFPFYWNISWNNCWIDKFNITNMNKQINIIEIPIDIYRMSVVIFFDTTLDKMMKWGIKNNINKERFTDEWKEWVNDEIKNSGGGFCVEYGKDNRDILIWIKKKPETSKEYGVLYHEIYHAVDGIAVSIDIENKFYAKNGMSEPRAYLFEYLINYCNNILWNLLSK